MIRFNKKYFVISLLLFITEILIAKYAHDPFIRPYLGDYLVVILLYCLLKIFVRIPTVGAASFVLSFACFVEYLQYLHLADKLNLSHGGIARILLGDYFTWTDILMYTLGIITVIICEKSKWQFHPDIHEERS